MHESDDNPQLFRVPDEERAEDRRQICFRELQAFHNVYVESSYRNACVNMRSTRRSVLKMVRDLEEVLGTSLFGEERKGHVSPSPFGERFFNDMRFLESAMERLQDSVETIRRERRVLRVGASPLVFRTMLFRSHLRELRTFEGIRVSYIQLPQQDAAKSLAAGEVDWLFDFQPLAGQRFISEKIGALPFCKYLRGEPEHKKFGSTHRIVPCGDEETEALIQNQWLRWLDYPAECEIGTVITSPRISADPHYWSELLHEEEDASPLALHATRLRQHPYEFLPGLAGKLITRMDKL